MVNIVASTCGDPSEIDLRRDHPDLIELRIDLMNGDSRAIAERWHNEIDIPLVITLRSSAEGGLFSGTAREWWEITSPLLPFASYVDIEQEFSSFAVKVKKQGPIVVGSYHTTSMPSPNGLREIEKTLRSYGDIPKIVVSPGTCEQVLDLLAFTCSAETPVITSIMGEKFRHIRAVLPLFGSSWAFGYAGSPTSPGQYSVEELKSLFTILKA
ncbi:MAG TPA: type I 3-dehydroquinate dehydratase [Methanoregulaceae archaeon]|nr:type I 3-dehydroquinate dehydratase [Methanoregulaceae archaeon]